MFEAFKQSGQKFGTVRSTCRDQKQIFFFLIFPVKSYDIEVSISLFLIQVTFIMLSFPELHAINKDQTH